MRCCPKKKEVKELKKMITEYKNGLELVESRINELSALRKSLVAEGDDFRIDELDLDRRISLLRTESIQTKEIIAHLSSIVRRRELSVET